MNRDTTCRRKTAAALASLSKRRPGIGRRAQQERCGERYKKIMKRMELVRKVGLRIDVGSGAARIPGCDCFCLSGGPRPLAFDHSFGRARRRQRNPDQSEIVLTFFFFFWFFRGPGRQGAIRISKIETSKTRGLFRRFSYNIDELFDFPRRTLAARPLPGICRRAQTIFGR